MADNFILDTGSAYTLANIDEITSYASYGDRRVTVTVHLITCAVVKVAVKCTVTVTLQMKVI